MIELTPEQERRHRHAVTNTEIDCPPLDKDVIDKLREHAAGMITTDEYIDWAKARAAARVREKGYGQ